MASKTSPNCRTLTCLHNKNQQLSALLGDNFDCDDSDMWLTMMAYCGFAAHRTLPFIEDGRHAGAYFDNDVKFLDKYEVRNDYEKYGAAAYFDHTYHLIEIEMGNKVYKRHNPEDGSGSSSADWLHAKWVWKVCNRGCTVYTVHCILVYL